LKVRGKKRRWCSMMNNINFLCRCKTTKIC
jgi:hypothetical protein